MPPHVEPATAGTSPPDAAEGLMPRPVRVAVLLGLAALLAGALAIVTLRGPAILIDLATSAGRWLCF